MSVGASIGSVIAEFSVRIPQLVFISCIGILRIRRILRYGLSYLVSGLITAVFLQYIDRYISYTVLGILADIFLGLTVYFAFLFVIRDRLIIDTIWKLLHRSKKEDID